MTNYTHLAGGARASSAQPRTSKNLSETPLDARFQTIVPGSALAVRLSRYVTLTAEELAFVRDIELQPLKKPKGTQLVNIGDSMDDVMILQSGWAVMKSYSKAHGYQILRIFLPGDVIGLAHIGAATATHQIIMQTDGTISQLSRKNFCLTLLDYPRLGALLAAITSLDLVAMQYHSACMRTMTASQNLKYFLLQLRSRLKVDRAGSGNRFELPFSQVEIGQAVGLTSIYVNKLLRGFAATGEIQVARPYIRLLERVDWENDTEYSDAYTNIDTSWFPPADKVDGQCSSFRRPSMAVMPRRSHQPVAPNV